MTTKESLWFIYSQTMSISVHHILVRAFKSNLSFYIQKLLNPCRDVEFKLIRSWCPPKQFGQQCSTRTSIQLGVLGWFPVLVARKPSSGDSSSRSAQQPTEAGPKQPSAPRRTVLLDILSAIGCRRWKNLKPSLISPEIRINYVSYSFWHIIWK